MSQPRSRGMDRFDSLLVTLSALFLLVGVLAVTANVASRYALHVPLIWTTELARYSIVWSALLGASVLISRRQHLTVATRTGGESNRVLDVTVAFGSMTFFSILAISGVILVRNTSGQIASSIDFLPMPVVYSIVPISALLMWLGSFRNLLRAIDRNRDTPRHDEEAT